MTNRAARSCLICSVIIAAIICAVVYFLNKRRRSAATEISKYKYTADAAKGSFKQKMSGKISVIVPFYNTGKFISRCIESITNQTYANIEVIAVDDGSTDGGADIVRALAEKDKRIRLISLPENGGTVAAYTRGVNEAEGEILSFVDSDDYIDSRMLEKLKDVMDEYDADISACSVMYVTTDGREISTRSDIPENTVCYSNQQARAYFDGTENGPFGQTIREYKCNKLFKKELFLGNLRYLDAGFSIFEDNCIVTPCLLDAKRIAFVNEDLYFYCRRGDSVMETYKDSILINAIKWVDSMERIATDRDLKSNRHRSAWSIFQHSMTAALRNDIPERIRILKMTKELLIDKLDGFEQWVKTYDFGEDIIGMKQAFSLVKRGKYLWACHVRKKALLWRRVVGRIKIILKIS